MKRSFLLRGVLSLLVLVLLTTTGWARDWEKYPARVDIPFASKVGAVGDIHGAFPEMVSSLEAIGFAKKDPGSEFGLIWTGGKDILVFTGDLNDRGLYTRQVFEAVMDLVEQAKKAGGQVIPLLGNHESLLLNGTTEKWAKTLKPPKQQHYQNTLDSFTKAGLDFHQAISAQGKHGAWIRNRPFFAIINGFLFIHGGLSKPSATLSDLVADFRDGIEADSWSKGIFMNENGPFWLREWWNDKALVDECLQKMGVRGVIFGHTIGAPNEIEGTINQKDNRIIGIDVGMCPAYGNSKGGGLLITIGNDETMVFTARYPDRPAAELFRVPAPTRKQVKPRPANEVLPRTGTAD